ncbi:MAG: hypothetical protein IRZ08_14640 [Frankia sp.]|nr:hypothetical protein [Frankia sp.]
MSVPGPALAGGPALFGPTGLFTVHRQAILIGLAVVVGLTIAIVAATWFSRRFGWRSTAGRLARAVRRRLAAVAEWLWAPVRHRLRVRFAAQALLDDELPVLRAAAFGAAGSRAAGSGGPGAFPYLLAVGPALAGVGLAGRPPPRRSATPDLGAPPGWGATSGTRRERPALPAPWRPDGPGRWTARRTELPRTSWEETADWAGCLVAVGVSGARQTRTLTLLDLAVLPAVGVLEGPRDQCRRLAAAIAAQLAAGLPVGNPTVSLLVTDEILPGYGGPALPEALDLLRPTDLASASAASPSPAMTLLVCGGLAGRDIERLAAAVRLDRGLRVLTTGPWPGSRWRLVLTRKGWLTAPELAVAVDAAPLERAVARALRRRASAPATRAAPASMPGPTSPESQPPVAGSASSPASSSPPPPASVPSPAPPLPGDQRVAVPLPGAAAAAASGQPVAQPPAPVPTPPMLSPPRPAPVPLSRPPATSAATPTASTRAADRPPPSPAAPTAAARPAQSGMAGAPPTTPATRPAAAAPRPAASPGAGRPPLPPTASSAASAAASSRATSAPVPAPAVPVGHGGGPAHLPAQPDLAEPEPAGDAPVAASAASAAPGPRPASAAEEPE